MKVKLPRRKARAIILARASFVPSAIRYRGVDAPPVLDPPPLLLLAPPELPDPLLSGALSSGELSGVEDGEVALEGDPGIVLEGVALSLVVPGDVAGPFVRGAIVPELLGPG